MTCIFKCWWLPWYLVLNSLCCSVFQFLTLKVGDERNQLIPVLNTMLKLSPEEKHTLQQIAQGKCMTLIQPPFWHKPFNIKPNSLTFIYSYYIIIIVFSLLTQTWRNTVKFYSSEFSGDLFLWWNFICFYWTDTFFTSHVLRTSNFHIEYFCQYWSKLKNCLKMDSLIHIQVNKDVSNMYEVGKDHV